MLAAVRQNGWLLESFAHPSLQQDPGIAAAARLGRVRASSRARRSVHFAGSWSTIPEEIVPLISSISRPARPPAPNRRSNAAVESARRAAGLPSRAVRRRPLTARAGILHSRDPPRGRGCSDRLRRAERRGLAAPRARGRASLRPGPRSDGGGGRRHPIALPAPSRHACLRSGPAHDVRPRRSDEPRLASREAVEDIRHSQSVATRCSGRSVPPRRRPHFATS